MNTRIIDDKAEIYSIEELGRDQNYFAWKVGARGVTAITPYEENGQMASITWLAIMQGDFVAARVPADKFAIVYKGAGENV